MLDAQLKLLGKSKMKGNKKITHVAVFELPPHKRTIFVNHRFTNKPYFVQFPYLIFVIPHYIIKNKYILIPDCTDYSHVSVYFQSNPLNPINPTKCRLTSFCYYRVCFGPQKNLYSPEKTINLLFAKIADLYFSTIFNHNYHPHEELSIQTWERQSMNENFINTINWNQHRNPMTLDSMFPNLEWQFFNGR